MSDKAKETKYIKTQVSDEQRCLLTANHGNRCRNPHLGNARRRCVPHEDRMATKGGDSPSWRGWVEAQVRAAIGFRVG
jgi:hypothetical protein